MTPSSSPGLQVSRRGLLAGGGAIAAAALAGCSSSSRTPVTFFQSKREAIQYFSGLLGDFDAGHPDLRVVHDIATNLSASFVRQNPPDIACQIYNLEMSRFLERGALTDLADMPEAKTIREDVQELVDWYPTYEDRTSVIPFSVAGAAVIYNVGIFEEHGIEVPETWTDFKGVCETLQGAGVTPIYGTFADPWTINQGLFDYTAGGMVDIRHFFDTMNEIGEDVGPDSEVSFQRTMLEPVQRMLELLPYHQEGASSRTYGDGNTALARCEAAMLLQGPWALAEAEKAGSDQELSTFPLPATENPDERKIRVGVDLALWIPEAADQQDGARELLSYFMTPEVQNPYNEALLALGTTKDAPKATDPRIAPMQDYYDAGMVTCGPSQFIPLTIPWENYLQSIVYGADPESVLARLDSDWARLAYRS